MKWQVFDLKNNTKDYYDPDTRSIIMRDCLLGNHATTAKKIFNGDNKTVCAWVACDDVRVVESVPPIGELTHYKYNPRKNPHWHTDRLMNADNLKFNMMVTNKRRVYG
jgi:hypothetical protein